MSIKYITLHCPTCGVSLDENQKRCPSCGVNLIYEIDSTGTSLLQIKQLLTIQRYSEATQKCNEFLACGVTTADVYFYLCISLLKGKKPYLQSRHVIDECIDALDKALITSSKGIIYLLRAYLEYDYFERKFLNRKPNYKDFLNHPNIRKIHNEERKQLEILLNNQIHIGGLS